MWEAWAHSQGARLAQQEILKPQVLRKNHGKQSTDLGNQERVVLVLLLLS